MINVLDTICHNSNVINFLNIFSIIFKFLIIMIPILLIVLFTYKLIKNKKNLKIIIIFIIKIIISIVIYFIPGLIFLFLSNFEQFDKFKIYDCLKCINNNDYCQELKELYINPINQDTNTNTKIYEQILPPDDANIIEKVNTDTFKYSVQKMNDYYGKYYITRIWVKNAYKQLHKYNSPEFGENLYYPSELLTMAINDNNLNNKAVFAFNANAFYENNKHQQSTVLFYNKYDKTSVGTLIITEGEVTRNFYDHWYKTWTIMGINENNQMLLFQDDRGNNIEDKKAKNQSIIDSGIRNTFSFASPLIINGRASSIMSSMPDINTKFKRQAICQIDNNNFILLTSDIKNVTFTRYDLINILLSLNCKTATNLDGGGSVTLISKNYDSFDTKIITGNSRKMTDIAYFTELEE